ncbi:MAG TPA: NAD-dependent epimerase/dehydratase family protein [Myxococcales bacterium]|nr:NAD-dependent epimerase/dehydratase family protein [Myxococcales bacterium]
MRCLVIGGAGFIGAAACKELMRRGVETIAAGRTSRPYGTFTSYVTLDRTDQAQLVDVLNVVRPEVVLDLAAYQPEELRTLLDSFDGERYVFVSTTGVYPDLRGQPAREEDFVPLEGLVPADPKEYREGKRWCETVLARTPERRWVAIRPPAVFGPEDHTLRIAAYLQRLEDDGPLLVPDETYEWPMGLAWVRDIGYACALACDLRREASGPYNVALEGVTLRDLLSAAGRALGRQVAVARVPYAELPDGASPYGPDPRRSAGYDLTRIRRELGFQPGSLEDALAETLTWYLARRPSHPRYAGRAKELEIAAARGVAP